MDPTVPASDVHALEGFVAESAARVRFTATLLALFATVALLLGATGIYGEMTAAVTRRTREIGVRMALGATSHGVLRMVLQESASVTVAGMMLGIAGAIAGAGLLRGLLFGVAAIDVSVLGAVATLLAAVAVIAAVIPARRASQLIRWPPCARTDSALRRATDSGSRSTTEVEVRRTRRVCHEWNWRRLGRNFGGTSRLVIRAVLPRSPPSVDRWMKHTRLGRAAFDVSN